MSEKHIQSAIRAAVQSVPGCRVFRNNVGKFKTSTGAYVAVGLALGSGDLIGLVNGRFISIEVKTPIGAIKPEQIAWMNTINKLGGAAIIARSVEDAVEFVKAVAAGTWKP